MTCNYVENDLKRLKLDYEFKVALVKEAAKSGVEWCRPLDYIIFQVKDYPYEVWQGYSPSKRAEVTQNYEILVKENADKFLLVYIGDVWGTHPYFSSTPEPPPTNGYEAELFDSVEEAAKAYLKDCKMKDEMTKAFVENARKR